MNKRINDFWIGYFIGKMEIGPAQEKLIRRCRNANILAFCAVAYSVAAYLRAKETDAQLRKIRKEIAKLKGE